MCFSPWQTIYVAGYIKHIFSSVYFGSPSYCFVLTLLPLGLGDSSCSSSGLLLSCFSFCSGMPDFDAGMGGGGGMQADSKILVIVVQNPKYPITVVSCC